MKHLLTLALLTVSLFGVVQARVMYVPPEYESGSVPGGMPEFMPPEIINQPAIPNISENCKIWNDGCNDCEKQFDGTWNCPIRNCANTRAGYCREWLDDSNDVHGRAPMPLPDPMPPMPEPEIPENCETWFDGCNTCGVQNGGLTFCTLIACLGETRAPYCMKFRDEEEEPPAEYPPIIEVPPGISDPFPGMPPIKIPPMPEPEIPENCESWFDGCNNCGVENGQLTFCTEMACDPAQLKPPYCTRFREGKPYMPEVDPIPEVEFMTVTIGPKKVPCDGFIGSCFVVNDKLLNYLIYGFEFEPGFIYEAVIRREKVEFTPDGPPPLDAEDYRHELVELLSKTPVTEDEDGANDKELLIPENCETWFDGCNTCGVENGKTTFCTRKACLGDQAPPYCLRFRDEEPPIINPPVIEDPVAPPVVVDPFPGDEDPVPPVISEPPVLEEPEIPEGCERWFDGCNTCGVEDGKLTFCTKMACRGDLREAYCKKFKEDQVLPEPDDHPIILREPSVEELEKYSNPPRYSFWTAVGNFFFDWWR